MTRPFIARALLVLGIAVALGACLYTTPEQELRESFGPEEDGDEEDGDEEHRPGQPCLVCHSSAFSPGDDVFAVAGTVYMRAADRNGVQGAQVSIVDDSGRAFVATTNRVGNFMVEVKKDLSAPREKEEGRLQIPWQPVFPLRIEISKGALSQVMKTYTWREGSCNWCHGPNIDATSVGRVYLQEEVTP